MNQLLNEPRLIWRKISELWQKFTMTKFKRMKNHEYQPQMNQFIEMNRFFSSFRPNAISLNLKFMRYRKSAEFLHIN